MRATTVVPKIPVSKVKFIMRNVLQEIKFHDLSTDSNILKESTSEKESPSMMLLRDWKKKSLLLN